MEALACQGKEWCQGACCQLFGKCCYSCHDPDPADLDQHCSYALDLGNARSVLAPALCLAMRELISGRRSGRMCIHSMLSHMRVHIEPVSLHEKISRHTTPDDTLATLKSS